MVILVRGFEELLKGINLGEHRLALLRRNAVTFLKNFFFFTFPPFFLCVCVCLRARAQTSLLMHGTSMLKSLRRV